MRLYDSAARGGRHTIIVTPGYQKAPGIGAPEDWFSRVTDSNGAAWWKPREFHLTFDPKVEGGAIDVPTALGEWLLENNHARRKPWSEKVLYTTPEPEGPRFRANHDVAVA